MALLVLAVLLQMETKCAALERQPHQGPAGSVEELCSAAK